MTMPQPSLIAMHRASTLHCAHGISMSYACRDCRRKGPPVPAAVPATAKVGVEAEEPKTAYGCAVMASKVDVETNHNEDNPDSQLPNSQQHQRPVKLVGDSEGEAQGPGCIPGSAGDSRPHVRITLHRVNLLDTDAKWASVKDVLDCCWRSSLIHGDREDEITLEVSQEKAARFKEEKTVVEITLRTHPR